MIWILFAGSVLIAYSATAFTIKISLRRGMLDLPNARSSHSVPVPRMGGLGILTAFYISIVLLAILRWLRLADFSLYSREVAVIVLAGAGMAAIGLVDDLHHLSPGTKFLMQFGVTTLVVAMGFRVEQLALPSWRPFNLGIAAFPLTILWLTGFSNVYNFMDGINGLAAGTGAVYGLFFFIFAWLQGSRDLGAIALLVSGSCIGFLFHNYPTARTFMGDSGSLFLGMVFALLVVRLAQQSSIAASPVALLLVCSVYLYDSTYTLIRRLRHGENIFLAHRSHLYQRLVQSGRSHVMITNLYLFLHALMGSLAVCYFLSSGPVRWWILGSASTVFLVFTLAVHQIENRAVRLSGRTSINQDPAAKK